MALPWQKVDNAAVLASMGKPIGTPLPRWVCLAEAVAVVEMGARSIWTTRSLAVRWGKSKSEASRICAEAEKALGQIGTSLGQVGGKDGASDGVMTPAVASPGGSVGAVTGQSWGASRARVPSGKIESGDQDHDAGDARAGEQGRPDPTSANPSRLSEVWEEERKAMLPELRGKPLGWLVPWDLDLLEAGPVDAEEAIRALAELCRGTAARAARVFEWSQLLGPGSRGLAGCWRDALAWKRGVGGEPAIGRAWRGGDGRSGAAGVGAGNGPTRSRKGTAVMLGQGKHDPYDDGWGDAAPGEREENERLFAESNAKREADRAAAGAVPPGGASR